jgi:hypothetical protein
MKADHSGASSWVHGKTEQKDNSSPTEKLVKSEEHGSVTNNTQQAEMQQARGAELEAKAKGTS